MSVMGKTSIFFVLAIIILATIVHCNPLPKVKLAIYGERERKESLVEKLSLRPNYVFTNLPVSDDRPLEVLVDFRVSLSFKSLLQLAHVQYEEIPDENASKITDPIIQSFPRYDVIRSYLGNISKDHSDVVKLFSIGTTWEGREILTVKISSGENDKPALFIDAGIHAREWIAPSTALYTIKQLVENRTNHYIFKDLDIYVVPVLNPDGYEYTHENPNHFSFRKWRKNRSRQNNTDCIGVDNNRNFGHRWMNTEVLSDPCSNVYAGSSAFSELENQALRNFFLTVNNTIKVYLSLHSYGQYILYPPSNKSHQVQLKEQTLKCVAEKAASELFKVRNTTYRIGDSEKIFEDETSGTSDEWAMEKAGIDLAYTIELPGESYEFVPPTSEIIPVGLETFEAIKVFAQYARNEICRTNVTSKDLKYQVTAN